MNSPVAPCMFDARLHLTGTGCCGASGGCGMWPIQNDRPYPAKVGVRADERVDGKSDAGPEAALPGLFNHLIGAADERGRKFDAEQLGGLHVDEEFDLRHKMDWQIRRLLATK